MQGRPPAAGRRGAQPLLKNQEQTMSRINELKNRAALLRIDSIRATTAAGSGHPTSCMSIADVMSVLYFGVMRFDVEHWNHEGNDRLILSKGHAAPVMYAAWKQLGLISDDDLMGLRSFGSPLEGHPTRKLIMGEAATGSLGQGLAIVAGILLSDSHQGAALDGFTQRAPDTSVLPLVENQCPRTSRSEDTCVVAQAVRPAGANRCRASPA